MFVFFFIYFSFPIGTPVHDPYSESSSSSRIQLLEFALAANVEQLRAKELSERETQNQIDELKVTIEREQKQAQEQIEHVQDMAEREKQRILRHLEDEKRFTRDIIAKSETMIEQLKRELSSERRRKTDDERTDVALRDIYKKISPRRSRSLTKFDRKNDDDDDDEQTHFDGETTVYHKDDPLLASTPRDRSFVNGRYASPTRSKTLRRRLLEEQLNDDDLDMNNSISKLQSPSPSYRSRLPPTSKRQNNSKFATSVTSSIDKTQSTIIRLDPTTVKRGK